MNWNNEIKEYQSQKGGNPVQNIFVEEMKETQRNEMTREAVTDTFFVFHQSFCPSLSISWACGHLNPDYMFQPPLQLGMVMCSFILFSQWYMNNRLCLSEKLFLSFLFLLAEILASWVLMSSYLEPRDESHMLSDVLRKTLVFCNMEFYINCLLDFFVCKRNRCVSLFKPLLFGIFVLLSTILNLNCYSFQ